MPAGTGILPRGSVPPVQGAVGGSLAENVIRQNDGSGVCLWSGSGYNRGGEVWTEVSRNRIEENGVNGVRLCGDDPVHSRIESNVILGNTEAGLRWDAVHDGWDLLVVSNTLAANGGDGILTAWPAGLAQLTNNIVVGNAGYGMFCASSEEPARSTNDVWGNGVGEYSGCTTGITDLSVDPLFVNAEGGSVRLRFGSPCIDAGVAESAPAMDIEGTPRPQGDGYDLGAYEFWVARIEVRSGDAGIPPGSRYEVGRLPVGSGLQTSFAIGKVGGSMLTVHTIEIAPPGDLGVTLFEPLLLTVTLGASTVFGIWFEPATAGEQTATVSIGSDAPEDSPYVFSVTGVGIQPPPTVTLSGPAAGLIGTEQDFMATVDPGGATQPITFTWWASAQMPQMNTGGLSDTVTYVWTVPGMHSIRVTAENAAGIAAGTHQITVYRPAKADFSAAPRSGQVPLAVVSTNTSTGDYDSSWWNFGDRMTSTLPSPTHTYRNPGVYTVTLQVVRPGGIDTRTKRAYVIVTGIRLYLPVIERRTGEGLGDWILTGRSQKPERRVFMRTIKITAASANATARLHENATANAVWEALPITGSVNRWGQEIYFEIPVRMPQATDAREVLEAGELGYWPVGHAFCIFWGPTPASRDREIRAYSPVNVFGQLDGDPQAFDAVSGGEEIRIEREAST